MQQGAGLEQSNERTGDFPVWLGQDPWEGARWPCRRAGGWVGVSLPCRDLRGLGLVRSSTGTAGVTAPSRRGQGGQRPSSGRQRWHAGSG